MQTIVIVGNSRTYVYGPFMITPRGYLAKYRVEG
jgi:precorrin-3B methylase